METSPSGCLRVVDGDTTVFSDDAAVPVIGASAVKLFTASTALAVLGPDARFSTAVRARSVVDGTAGDLWLVGGGDPVLGTKPWAATLPAIGRVFTSLETLADRVVAAGLRQVTGQVIGDESRYDAQRLVPTMPARLVADAEVGPLSALTINDGFRSFGHPAIPFTDPPVDAASLFADLLRQRGVRVDGSASAGAAPSGTAEIASVSSPPVGELVHAMLRDSDNGTAELLVKELGRSVSGVGSSAAGVRAMRDHAASLGVPLGGVTLADGSGLGTADRLTCGALTAVLVADQAALEPRLSIAGVDGTLRRRFAFAPGLVRAKTGSLDGVAALAGYARTADGTSVAFAYVINGLNDDASGRAFQDRLVAALVSPYPETT